MRFCRLQTIPCGCALAILWAIGAGVTLVHQSVGAQDFDGGVAAGPTFIEANVVPGGTWRGSFRLAARDYGAPATFDMEVMDLAQQTDGSRISVERGKGTRSAAGWLEVPSEITLTSGERVDIPLRLQCPREATGSYSAMVVIKLRQASGPISGIRAEVIPSIAIEILIKVRSQGPLHVEVADLRWIGRGRNRPPDLAVSVVNTGVWRAEFSGEILVYPAGGGFPTRATLPLYHGGRPQQIYPGQRITLECPLERTLPPGAYTALARLDLGENRESRQRFSLEISASGGQKKPTVGIGPKEELGGEIWLDKDLFELNLPPGATRTIPVRVQNLSSKKITIKASVHEAKLGAEGDLLVGNQASLDDGGVSVEVRPDSLVLTAKRSGSFRAIVKMDRNVETISTVVKQLRLTGRANNGPADDDWQTVYDTGALILITPPKADKPFLKIADLALVRSSSTQNPGSALLTVHNTGGTTGFIKGTMVLKWVGGAILSEMDLTKDEWHPVLPQGRKRFRMPMPLLAEGNFVVVAEIMQKDSGRSPDKAEKMFVSTESVPAGLR